MAKQPFVPVANIIRFRYAGTNQGAPWVNGYAIQYVGTKPDGAAMMSLAASLKTAYTTTWGSILGTTQTLVRVDCWDITDASGSVGYDTTGFTGVNTVTNPLPVQCAVVVSWPVQNRWRGGHFRTYVIPRTLSDITLGRQLTSGATTAFQTAAANFKSAVNALTVNSNAVTLCGVRYFPTGFNADGTPITKTSGTPYAFLNPVVHNRIDSQRRRSGKELSA